MDSTQKVSLSAFVTARLDEKEQRALGTPADRAEAEARTVLPWLNELAPPVPRDEVALREVAAMRAVLARHVEVQAWSYPPGDGDEAVQGELETVIRHLASIWSDHPDYDPEWTP